MPTKKLHSSILIAIVAIVAITAVTVILLTYAQKGALVGEAAQRYQVGGYTGPLPTYVNETKLFCDKVNNCGLAPVSGGSLKVVDATGREVGILVDAPVAGKGDVVKVFDTNVQKFLNYNLYNVTNGTNDSYPSTEDELWFETEDCSSQGYLLAPPNWGGTKVGANNPYTPLVFRGTLYAFSDYQSINVSYREGIILRSRTRSIHPEYPDGCEAIPSLNLSNPIYAGYYLSIIEEFNIPTYKGPLSIVVK